MKLIKKSEIPPGPRLELRWSQYPDTGAWKLVCEYLLLVPIDQEKDIRDRDINYENGMLFYTLGTTTIRFEAGIRSPIMPDGSIELPKRDGKHALWDSDHLGNLPVWATWEDQAMLVEESEVPVTKVNNRPMRPVRHLDWELLEQATNLDQKTVEVDRILLKRLMYEVHELHVKLRNQE